MSTHTTDPTPATASTATTATTALPVWPVNTDYSTHREVVDHLHICPDCQHAFDCPNPWVGQVCQAVEWHSHDVLCASGAPATPEQLDSLRGNLHRISPGWRSRAREAVPTT